MMAVDNLSGQRIKGYELREVIGTGGFGAVYLAHQPHIGREVAIKIILPEYANQPDFIRRFEVEARVIARLEHPHIIPLYDYWRDPNGAYLVMRYLRGGSVRALLAERALQLEEVGRILEQIGPALAVAHRHDVVHRDIKPDNILLDEENNAYLTDFGIAKDLASDATITRVDMVVGSPAYLSPEQIKNEPVTPQSDIYCLGVVIYELLTGQHPFPGELATTLLLKHLNEPLPSITDLRADIPPGIEHVIQRATAKDPADRFIDVGALVASFKQAMMLDAGTETDPALLAALGQNETVVLDEMTRKTNPYKGLQAFEEIDAPNFFGREALINRLLSKLRPPDGGRFLAIVGPSGSGKSSVVGAGMIPRLRRGTLPGSADWFVVQMAPGAHPLEELEAALLRVAVNPPSSLLDQLREDERGLVRAVKRILASEQSELFLFIDQLEHVFTMAEDRAEVAHFLNSLVAAVADETCRLRMVITLRADFYDRPLLYPAFGELVRRSTEVVLPLNTEELERAIARPAERIGVTLEPGLVGRIIADVSEQPGALPLLQYALMELFDRREGNVLTLEAYTAIGGALGALARRAQELYDGLNARDRALARQLFLRLVALRPVSGDDTRRRAYHAELLTLADDMVDVIRVFGEGRMLTFDHDPITREPTVEIAHDALIHQWPLLQQWLIDSREDLIMHRRLEAAADEWLAADREASYLAMGGRLDQFAAWRDETDIALSEEESSYLEASLAARAAAQAEEDARRAREALLEQRSLNRLRLLVGVLAVAVVVASLLTAFAFTQSEAASEARDVAEANAALAATAQVEAETNALIAAQRAQQARGLALAANARNLLAEHNPNLALTLAIAAYEASDPPTAQVQQTLARSVYSPAARYRLDMHDGSVLDAATNGERVLTVALDGTMILWDLADGGVLREDFNLMGGAAHSVVMTADGQRAITGMFNGTVLLWDLDTGQPLLRFPGHTDIVTSVDLNADETRLLTASFDRTLRVWDVTTGEELQRIEARGALLKVAFSPNGLRAVTGSADLTAGPNHPPHEQDRSVSVWDLETGAQVRRFRPDSGFVRAVDFAPDGLAIISGTWSSDLGGTLQLWNLLTGALEQRFYGHSDVITDVQFNDDGTQVYSASWDRTVRAWDVATGMELMQFAGHDDRVLALDLSPGGDHLLATTGNSGNNIPDMTMDRASDPAAWWWDLRDRAQIMRLDGHEDWIWSVAVSPDGRLIASGSGPIQREGETPDTSIRIWDATTGAPVEVLDGHSDTVHGLAFNSDGSRLASAGWDGTVRIWNTEWWTGHVAFREHEGRVLSVAYHPTDDDIVLSAAADGTIRQWRASDGRELMLLAGHDGGVNHAVYSANGSQIASAGDDGTVRLWDAETGAELAVFTGHSGTVTGVRFSPDGTHLLSSGWDTTARLWDIAGGAEVRQFIGHGGPVFSPVFTDDGTMALTGSADRTIRVWDVLRGDEVRRFDDHTNWVLSLMLTPDGDRLVSGAEDNTVRVWRMADTLDALVAWGRSNRYVPDLTCAQREQYNVDPPCETGENRGAAIAVPR
jgi:WD40 repeat protein